MLLGTIFVGKYAEDALEKSWSELKIFFEE